MIYFHYPYCRKRCSYCNFHFSTSHLGREDMEENMLKELDSRLLDNHIISKDISSVYFGGGTPSLASVKFISKALEIISIYKKIKPTIEITVEVNPEDVSPDYLLKLKNMGVNRLSMGIQTFSDSYLAISNRAHNSEQAKAALFYAADAGFQNVSTDLMYGFPQQSIGEALDDLEVMIAMGITHFSAYALTVEPNTVLQHWINTKKILAPDEDLQAEAFFAIRDLAQKRGFIQYEISNFGLPGQFSKHNTGYWQGKLYLGIGPSAHSFDGFRTRRWNIANNQVYNKKVKNGEVFFEEEMLSDTQRINEIIMLGLRTIEGISLEKLKEISDDSLLETVLDKIEKLNPDYFNINNDTISLNKQHWFHADGIAAELFF